MIQSEDSVKKFFVLLAVLFLLGLLAVSCSKQTAIDQIMRNPQMKSQLMNKMMEDQTVRNSLIETLAQDTAWVSAFTDVISRQTQNRDRTLQKLIQVEGIPEMLMRQWAEDPVLKAKMKEYGK